MEPNPDSDFDVTKIMDEVPFGKRPKFYEFKNQTSPLLYTNEFGSNLLMTYICHAEGKARASTIRSILLQKPGIDVNAQQSSDWCALQYAAYTQSDFSVFRCLIEEFHALVTFEDKMGNNLLEKYLQRQSQLMT